MNAFSNIFALHPSFQLFVLFLGLVACAPTPVPPARTEAELITRFDAEVTRLMARHRIPGASIGLIHQGEVVWVKGYGFADRSRKLPMTAETVFQAASISKPVTAWGVMSLVEEGELELDAPVSRYLTRWQLPPSEFSADGVTIRRLLSHTAGLSLEGYWGYEPTTPLPTLEASLSRGVRLILEPGTEHRYSGGGYTLLQLIVEEVTGETFAHYMERAVLKPLGMAHSSFVWTPQVETSVATPYGWFGTMPVYRYAEQAAAGLYTTAADLARFATAMMPGRKGEPAGRGVLSPDVLKLMFSPQPASTQYGLGYSLIPEDGVVYHRGSNRGWRALLLTRPARGDGLVVVINSDRGDRFRAAVADTWLALQP